MLHDEKVLKSLPAICDHLADRTATLFLGEALAIGSVGAQLTRGEWLDGLARICLADVRKMFDKHGTPLPITELESAEASAIAAFEVYTGLVVVSSDMAEVGSRMLRVRMVDQLKAIELYGKAMGCLSDRREAAGAAEGPPIITVEFVDPPDQPCHTEQETPVGEKPRSVTVCGRTLLTY